MTAKYCFCMKPCLSPANRSLVCLQPITRGLPRAAKIEKLNLLKKFDKTTKTLVPEPGTKDWNILSICNNSGYSVSIMSSKMSPLKAA